MRWGEPEPRMWETRLMSEFLWFPLTIEGVTRWLEKATWRERAFRGWISGKMCWEAESWVVLTTEER